MQRTGLQDTSPEAWQIMLKLLRAMTPEERVRKTFEMIEAAREFRKRTEHLRERPESSE